MIDNDRYDGGVRLARMIAEALEDRLGERTFELMEMAERIERDCPGKGLEWLKTGKVGGLCSLKPST